MATTVAKLQAILSAETSDFDRKLKESEGRMGKTGRVAGALGLALAGGLAIGAKKAVDAASDLNEQVNKTNVVFGKSGKGVNKWATGLAQSFGLSTRAALEAAGTFGNMLVPMGFARKQAAGMSKNMVQLAGDMASFNNASPEETLEALRSGLAGETEPLRKFGVFLNQDRVEAEALQSGLVKATVSMADVHMRQVAIAQSREKLAEAQKKYGAGSLEVQSAEAKLEYAEKKLHEVLAGKVPALTAAQKAQATYNLILKDTASAHGDFARTSGSAANQERILKAELENLSAQIGANLLPIVVAIMQKVTAFTGYLAENKTQAKILVGVLGALATALLVARAAQILMNLAVLANPYVLATVAIIALAAGVFYLYLKVREIRPVLEFMAETFLGIPLPLRIAIAALGGFQGAFDKLKGPIMRVADAIHTLYNWLKKALDYVKDLVSWIGKIHAPKIHLPDLNPFNGDASDPNMTGPSSVSPSLYDELSGARRFGLALTSGYRPGAVTKHGTRSDHSYFPSKAIDVAGSPSSMAAFFRWLIGQTDVKQAFYDPLGSIFGGILSSYREGGHSDHVHVATYDQGGFLRTGWNLAYNGTGRPEPVGAATGGPYVFPIQIGDQDIATIVFDPLRRMAKVFRGQNGRSPF